MQQPVCVAVRRGLELCGVEGPSLHPLGQLYGLKKTEHPRPKHGQLWVGWDHVTFFPFLPQGSARTFNHQGLVISYRGKQTVLRLVQDSARKTRGLCGASLCSREKMEQQQSGGKISMSSWVEAFKFAYLLTKQSCIIRSHNCDSGAGICDPQFITFSCVYIC